MIPRVDVRLVLLLACFFLSGFAGLIYETAWTQQFSLVFGSSELALAAVLAAYMAGLAAGATAAGRWTDRVRRPVLVYALLELGIGLTALAVPVAIDVASRVQVMLLGGSELTPQAGALTSTLFYLGASFTILLIPTALMGATLPLLARWAVRRTSEIGPRIGLLYSANTAGAAAGTLVAAFLLLPRIGLGSTVLAAVAVNLLVFVLATMLARGGAAESAASEAETEDRPTTGTSRRHWILPLVLVSGAVSFSWEILWTRLLSNLVGGSVYAFATMLATFLTGIALGSMVASRLAADPEKARRGFATAQIAVAGLSLAAFVAADKLSSLASRLAAGIGSSGRGQMEDPTGGQVEIWSDLGAVVLSAATLLPGAIAIGATFPFAVRCLATDAASAARASARVFSWNTAGAITGALATGYFVLPALRFAGTAAAAAALSLILAMIAALVAVPRRTVLAAAALAGLGILAIAPPTTPWKALRHTPLSHRETPGEVTYYGVGRSATVLLLDQRSGWRLLTNGLPESMIHGEWGRPGQLSVTHWLSLLPLVARPETRSMLVVGLGGGVTVEEIPASIEEIHVVELELEVLGANRRLADHRRRNPLIDPRLRLHVNDARGALRLTEQHFDAVVSQPSHPWTSGASNLFTREFFTLVRERLSPDGVFVQWMGLPFVDEPLLRSLVATAIAAFPQVEVYQPTGGAIFLLASAEPLESVSGAKLALAGAPREWAQVGVMCPEDIVAARVLDAAGARRFATGAGISTDSKNLLRTRSPKILRDPLGNVGAERAFAPHDPLLADPRPDTLYMIRRLIRQGTAERARKLADGLTDPVARKTAIGLVELAAGRESAGELALREALGLDSEALEARHGLLSLYRPAILRGEPVALAERFRGEPAAAVIAGWRHLGSGESKAISHFDADLAAIDVKHPLFADATRLRAEWRIAGGDPHLAAEAMSLIEPLLAPQARSNDLLLHARAAAAAGVPGKALAALAEALPKLQRASEAERQARSLLRSLPRDETLEDWRSTLEQRLRQPARQRGSGPKPGAPP